MDDSTNLCLSCGLCCDGTVLGFVQLGREEVPAFREMMDIENTNGEGFFLQPCKKYCGGCTIYLNRPSQCAKFQCGLLKSLEQKEIRLDSAIEITDVVKQKKIDIERKLSLLQIELRSQSFYFQMSELKKLLQKNISESTMTQTHLDLLSDLDQLDNLMINKFGDSMF